MPIVAAITKYGEQNFIIEVLEFCSSIDELLCREKYWAKRLNTYVPNGYNLYAGLGRGVINDELRKGLSEKMKGRKVSIETREKLRRSRLGRKLPQYVLDKMSAFMKGKKLSKLAIENAIKASIKTYTLYDPNNHLVTITNMRQFCIHNNLSQFRMCEVVKGRSRIHKGWTIYEKPDNELKHPKYLTLATRNKLSEALRRRHAIGDLKDDLSGPVSRIKGMGPSKG